MYAIHQPLFFYYSKLLRRLYLHLQLPGSVENLLIRLIGLGVSILLAVVLHLILSKFAPKALKLVTGNRA